jgi:hypothetical protein
VKAPANTVATLVPQASKLLEAIQALVLFRVHMENELVAVKASHAELIQELRALRPQIQAALLTKGQAATHLGCSKRTIDRYRTAGLKHLKQGGRLLFRREDLDALRRPRGAK